MLLITASLVVISSIDKPVKADAQPQTQQPCLLKNSGDKTWRIAFMQIRLLKEFQTYDENLHHTKNVMLIHRIFGRVTGKIS